MVLVVGCVRFVVVCGLLFYSLVLVALVDGLVVNLFGY